MHSSDMQYDRAKEVKSFDDSKIGVKGLVDSGITTIPRFFIHSSEILSSHGSEASSCQEIPLIDLSSDRSIIINQIREASRKWGFFQIINHNIPSATLAATISAIRTFNELPIEEKSEHYIRKSSYGVSFASNFDLFRSKAATWRDTLQVTMAPVAPDFNRIPSVCRNEFIEWDGYMKELGALLLGYLSEGLGLNPKKLEELGFLDRRTLVSHYYPYCPQPDLTLGIASHKDPVGLTVLLQDQIGGLQVKFGETWVDVKPVEGTLVVNVGDILQMISNDGYKSVEHRVVANSGREARVSMAFFFSPGKQGDISIFGPLPELLSQEKPPLYRNFTMFEFLKKLFSSELGDKSLIESFKIEA